MFSNNILMQRITKTKYFITILILCIVSLGQSSIQPSDRKRNLQQNSNQLPEPITGSINIQVRRDSKILYRKTILTNNKYMYFMVYQNKFGTFLSIASFNYKTSEIDVSTLIKLANGRESNDNAGQQYEINPLFYEIIIEGERYEILVDSRGLVVQNSINQISQNKNMFQPKTGKDIQIVDTFIRLHYPLFVNGAMLVKTQEVVIGKISYILLTYNHKSGVYLVVANLSYEKSVNINTFVRLGQSKKERIVTTNFQQLILGQLEPLPIFII